MGRGPVVAKRRDAVNAVKGKVFSLHAKLISIAAQKGGDPDSNPSLASAIYKAKKDGVPNDNIERSIKKGTGEDKSGNQIVEVVYEGYASGGTAVMVSVLTDNKNRTVSSIRHIFSKYGGNMGESGAVSWMFHRKGVIFISSEKYDYEKIEELVFETKAEDIIKEDSYIKIITQTGDLHEVEKFFEDKGIEIIESKLDYIPDTEVEITEFDKALKFKKMIEAFEEDEDVHIVSTNEIISKDLEKQVDDFIEKNKFRT
ncbi:YebC/PmpR family DNA-binding transcriptional regulator [Candidatus Gracilibacteria bacterium]|nr:MAG: YebC/PmpR family DNA-binding transcriptional regulator [Candidatus Gracilibacteria bacterium]PIE85086.1 MAG: YebC/PmpR family DNA-binding transcriptional regulator [Candidatus Gracilibacteria bacterium]